MSGIFHYLLFLTAICGLLGCGVEMTRGAEPYRNGHPRRVFPVGLEMGWNWGDEMLVFGREGKSSQLKLTRADFLMSQFALRRPDGSWLETGNWAACFRGAEGLRKALLEGVPSGIYTAVRFDVGVSAEDDRADPNVWPAGHALHPLVNGLHWGWQGGYIYVALEGTYPQEAGRTGGFSYHLAGQAMRNTILLEGALNLTAGGTIGLTLDAEKILGSLDPAVFGTSTHSREGDQRAVAMKEKMAGAFRLRGVVPEVWQDQPVTGSGPRPAGTPWPVRISTRLPKVALPPDNMPTVEGVALGRSLFHDVRLSGNNTQSCASCHQPAAAFSDPGKRFSTGIAGQEGERNAMPLFNLAWQQEFFWDGRSKGLRHQVLEPVQDPVEMHQSLGKAVEKLSGDASLAGAFEAAFGSRGVTPERIGLALEQFLLTNISQDSRFDRALAGREKLSAEERRGLELFVTEHDPARSLRGADCFHCHGGALFSNQGFANNGLDAGPLPGRAKVTGQAMDHGKFRVPSLRNIALTGPYMHDGRFRTLEEVVEHYDHGVQRTATLDPNLAKHPAGGLGLTAADKAALVAFLRTLTEIPLAAAVPDFPQTLSKP